MDTQDCIVFFVVFCIYAFCVHILLYYCSSLYLFILVLRLAVQAIILIKLELS